MEWAGAIPPDPSMDKQAYLLARSMEISREIGEQAVLSPLKMERILRDHEDRIARLEAALLQRGHHAEPIRLDHARDARAATATIQRGAQE